MRITIEIQGGTMRRSLRVAIVMGLFIFTANSARAAQWEKTYKISGHASLRVETNDASIEVEAGDAPEIHARVITNGWDLSPSEVRITRDYQSGDRVEIEVTVPRMHWSWSGSNRSVRIEITVPRSANLDLHSGDGHINVSGVSGDLRIDTGDGHVTATDLHGSIRIRTGDGHIEASGLDGTLDAMTRDGRVHIRGRFDALRLETGDGSVSAEILPGSKMSNDWSVRTGDGSVTVRLPDGFAAQVDAHTGDGRISSQLPITVSGSIGSSDLRGKLGAGGSTFLIRTGDGSIRLERM
jgi:DUF4097 and DUF4098 domain-containing protein YvlB